MKGFSTHSGVLTPKSWVRFGFAGLAALFGLVNAAADPLIRQIRDPSGELQITGRFCGVNEKLFPGARPLILFNHNSV